MAVFSWFLLAICYLPTFMFFPFFTPPVEFWLSLVFPLVSLTSHMSLFDLVFDLYFWPVGW